MNRSCSALFDHLPRAAAAYVLRSVLAPSAVALKSSEPADVQQAPPDLPFASAQNWPGLPVRGCTRKLGNPKWTDDQLIDFMVAHPILMNRPIVMTTLATCLCRPSEAVLDILPSPQLVPFVKEDGEPVVDAHGKRTGHHVDP